MSKILVYSYCICPLCNHKIEFDPFDFTKLQWSLKNTKDLKANGECPNCNKISMITPTDFIFLTREEYAVQFYHSHSVFAKNYKVLSFLKYVIIGLIVLSCFSMWHLLYNDRSIYCILEKYNITFIMSVALINGMIGYIAGAMKDKRDKKQIQYINKIIYEKYNP